MAEPEFTDKVRRWLDGAEKVAMACCEAGYPCVYTERTETAVGLISFHGAIPPDEVLLKAGDLAGIRDLIEEAFLDVGREPSRPSVYIPSEEILRSGVIGSWP